MAKPTQAWAFEDVVDFEVYLHQDEETRLGGGGEDVLGKRDRRIFLHELGGQGDPLKDTPQLRRVLFRGWLEVMRRQERNPDLRAGSLVGSALGHVSLLAIGGGIVLGLVAIMGAFYYGTGNEHVFGDQMPKPVNVFLFLGICVLPQFVFAIGAAMFLVFSLCGFSTSWPSLYVALETIFRPMIRRASLRGMEAVGAEDRERLRATMGVVTGRASLHHNVLKWLLPLRIQWFGLIYGVTLFLAMLLMVVFSDRSCGWYSSKWLTPERVHSIVRSVAFPWAHLAGEGVGYPTLEQIRGSQIRLSEGAKQLKDQDLKSWLSFLLWCVAIYGVVPRALMLGMSYWCYRRALTDLELSDPRSDKLYERLTTAPAGFETGECVSGPAPAPGVDRGTPSTKAETAVLGEGSCALFAPPDLLDSLDQNRITDLLSAKFGWRPAIFEVGGGTAAQDRTSIAHLSGTKWNDDRPRILFVQRGYMPPTSSILGFIRECRKACGSRAKIIVALVGKPQGSDLLITAKEGDFQVWTNKVNGLGDPNCIVERLV